MTTNPRSGAACVSKRLCGALLLLPCLVSPALGDGRALLPAADQAAADCSDAKLDVAFAVTNVWSNGFVGEVKLTARERAVDGWVLRIRRTNRITEVWGAKLVERGGYYELTPEAWTRSIAARTGVSFGFRMEGGARRELAECTLDGAACFRHPQSP
jgi:cellulase/cellobiase CelA1